MKTYSVRLKTQINFVKDVSIEAEDKNMAYRIAQCKAGDMLTDCIKIVEGNDKSISHNMSYYDTTIPKETMKGGNN